MGHELVWLEDVLAQDVLARPDEVVVERDVPVAADAGDLRLRVEGEERDRRVRGMDDVAELATDDRVVAVVAGDGVAEVAALLVAVEILAAEEPAARPLVDVAAQCAEIPDERRGDALGGLREQREPLAQLGVFAELLKGHDRADGMSVTRTPTAL